MYPIVHEWLDAMKYLADASDAPEAAREAASTNLTAYERAELEHRKTEATKSLISTRCNQLNKDAAPDLVTQLLNGKKTTVRDMATQILAGRRDLEIAQTASIITQRALAVYENRITGSLLREHAHELEMWIARRRQIEPTICGETDHLSKAVQIIYLRIQSEWLPDWNEPLSLGNLRRLPLVYDATWPDEYRASLAWVWAQLAEGNVERIPAPQSKQENSARFLVPTRRPISLPIVPPAIVQSSRRK